MNEEVKNNKSPLYNKLSALLMTDDLRVWNYPESNMYSHLDINKEDSTLKRSTKVEEASAFIEELNVDIAADKMPANNKPFNPTGKYSTIKVLNSRSLLICTPLKK